MNPLLDSLQPYPFEKLRLLMANVRTNTELEPLTLSIGEPQQAPPELVKNALSADLDSIGRYPLTKGSLILRTAFVDWLTTRFSLPPASLDPDRHVLPVNGTREALFAIAQCVIDPGERPLVLLPNPFYQIYEGAALLAGATPRYVNCSEATHFLPDIDTVTAQEWDKCQLLYLCSPANPTGAVMDQALLESLITLSETHDFVIAADECYSEIYFDEAAPPCGLLQAAANMGLADYRRCIVFHSLSKRSNVPGLRSGFVAGDAELIERFFLYRTYHGCAMPPPTQAASAYAWRDEVHVRHNRRLYREKFEAVHVRLAPFLSFTPPAAGFYLWPRTPVDDTEFARELFARMNVLVLPGSYLSRATNGSNPGHRRVRMALVPPLEKCTEAADRIAEFLQTSSKQQ